MEITKKDLRGVIETSVIKGRQFQHGYSIDKRTPSDEDLDDFIDKITEELCDGFSQQQSASKLDLCSVMRCASGDIKKLEDANYAGVTDLFSGDGLFWLIKRIILKHEKRITELEVELAGAQGRIG